MINILFLNGFAQGASSNLIWNEWSSQNSIVWSYNDFSGFFYDLDRNIGTEYLEIHMTKLKDKYDRTIGQGELLYTTKSNKTFFKFREWGEYNIIGFLGEKYFVGYNYDSILMEHEINFLSSGSLCRVLKDENTKYTLGKGSALKLDENYEVDIIDIDPKQNAVVLYLRKNGNLVDQKIVTLDPNNGGNCIFKKNVFKEMTPLIILHLADPFDSNEINTITIDGIFQISDKFFLLDSDFNLHDIDLQSSAYRINLNNKKPISLNNGNTILLFRNLGLKVADSNELRFMLIEIKSSGYRSPPIDPAEIYYYALNASNFNGFYYDINNNFCGESINLTISEGKNLHEPNGVIYRSIINKTRFNFTDWGYFNIIGFLGKKYFAGYAADENISPEDQILCAESIDKNSLADDQLEAILRDENAELSFTSDTPLKLDEDYELAIRSIDIDGRKVYLELSKKGTVVDSKIISPSVGHHTMSDETYYYRKTIGDQEDLIILGVHFKNAFRSSGTNIATVDGIWQISDAACEVKPEMRYGKMRIKKVDSVNGVIVMDNKESSIGLGRDEKINLMGDIYIKTADADNSMFVITRL